MNSFFFVLFCIVFIQVSSNNINEPTDDDLVVQLSRPVGKIRGHTLQSRNGRPIYAFQDVPFAQPPVGKNRFQLPKPLDGWNNILDTTKNEKSCLQGRQQKISMGKNSTLGSTTSSEDCLVLNVYSPVKPGSDANLPVYFVVHGGAFSYMSGAIDFFNPALLLDFPIIVVTANYRLGLLGFLTTNDGVIPANLALKDQHFALKWTYDNIHLFGGDPKKITLGGESAGGASSGYHLLSRQNKGLIRGIIQQSGGGVCSWAYQINSRDIAFATGKLLDSSFNSNSSTDLLKLLQNSSPDDLISVDTLVPVNGREGFVDDLNWSPVIEDASDPNAFVTGNNLENIMNGAFNLVPTLLGSTSEESLHFIPTDSVFQDFLEAHDADPSLLISKKFNVDPKLIKTAGLELKNLYTKELFTDDHGALVRFTSDSAFGRPTIHQAEVSSEHVPTYLYQFSFSTTPSSIPGTDNVGHGGESPYFWNNKTVVNEVIRNRLLKLWTNFIIYQNPTPELDNDLQNIQWPTVKTNNVQYLNINASLEIKSNPKNYYEIKEILNKYRQRPYITY